MFCGADMKILVIHTGGTIGMVRSASGFAPQTGVVEAELARIIAEDRLAAEIDLRVLDPLIDSANATPEDWNRLSQNIAQQAGTYDAFVVTHGTDTMAYSAAALCFALQGLDRPVILTGSMLPLSEPENDGAANLRAALGAALTAEAGIWVQFADKLLNGGRVRKSHSRAFDAFAAEPTARAPRRDGAGLIRHVYQPREVAILPVAPAISMDVFAFAARHCDGVILRCYGSGTVPNSAKLETALLLAQSRDVPVLAVSQCPEGGITLGTYAAGAVLKRTGVVDGRDMTVEAAYAKMHHVLSTPAAGQNLAERLAAPLASEFND